MAYIVIHVAVELQSEAYLENNRTAFPISDTHQIKEKLWM